MRPLLKSRRREKLRNAPAQFRGGGSCMDRIGVEGEMIFGTVGRDLPGMLAGRPYAAFEHEIELLRLADFIISIRVPYVVFLA